MRALLDQLSAIKNAKFASFTYRAKGTGELSRYLVILGANIEKVYQDDAEKLATIIPTLTGEDLDAANAILTSLQTSLDSGIGNNPAYTHGVDAGDTYATTDVPGIKVNKNDGALHLCNVLLHNKKVIEEGTPKKPVKSSSLTLAKKKIERSLRKSDIRQFALSGISVAKLNGETIEFD